MTFSNKDLAQIRERGSDTAIIEQQIENFRTGFPFMPILKPATLGAGIIADQPEMVQTYIQHYENSVSDLQTVKFVPASGAASRMFKNLFAFRDDYKGTAEQYAEFIADQSANSMYYFFDNLKKFAFYEDLEAAYGSSLENALHQKKYVQILQTLLDEDGLNYGTLPKGLLQFHHYQDDTNRTPVEEHLIEGANYAQDGAKNVRLHFTVSPEHSIKFEEHITQVRNRYETKFGVHFDITFSQQKPSTDTIAVDLENQPFREADGSILFRPGGHGALIENLNDIDADLIFIKNIDNVVPDSLKSTTYKYKKALAGVALAYQERIFEYLRKLDENPNATLLEELATFYQTELCTLPAADFAAQSEASKVAYFRQKLHRPIRACGMVRNEGEPGGGPFWTINGDGTTGLQIVESAQIDMQNPEAKQMMENSTHFNPVDLVCLVRDYQGNKFDLVQFRDPKTGFIAYKSKNGQDLKAQELPGLWNGAMSDWNTLFLEVPIITFNPVKMVTDLLKEAHQ